MLKMENNQISPFASSKGDPGLCLLLILFHFLRNTCREVVHEILLCGFSKCLFIQENLLTHHASTTKPKVTVATSLLSLLCQIQDLSRSQEQRHKRKEASGGKDGQQPKAQCPKRSHLIHDIEKNEDILSQVTVQDLLSPKTEVIQRLKDLDLIFVLNMITNEILHYQLPDHALTALSQLKEIRTSLFHPRLKFSLDEFKDNLQKLGDLIHTLYKCQGYPSAKQEQLAQQLHLLREQASLSQASQQNASNIFDELVKEVHEHYAPTSCFVLPKIIDRSDSSVVEDLGKFILKQKNLTSSSGKQPTLLCGPHGSGKSIILQNLAHSLSRLTAERGPFLVLHLHECSNWGKQSIQGAERRRDFWEKVYRSIRVLGPNTVNKYGLEAVRLVINLYINDTVFLVDWEMDILDKLCSEMQKGSWVLAYQKTHFPSPDWHILTVEAFEEIHITQFLEKYKMLGHTDMIPQYKECDYNHILTSPEMMNIFCEMKNNIIFDTDFEMISYFVEKKIGRSDFSKEVMELYELAFISICKKRSVLTRKHLIGIDDGLCKLFLVEYMPNCFRFIHQIVQDFLAARYVVYNPDKACKEWLDNVKNFKSVFKFVCAIWSQNKSDINDNIKHVQDYIGTLFNINCKENLGKSHEPCGAVESMDVDEGRGKKKKKQKQKNVFVNPVRDPFTEWNFLIQLDDACSGQRECLKLFAKLLCCIPYWDFKVDTLNERKLKRIEKILKKVNLREKPPVVIRLECHSNIFLLNKLWNMLKNIEGLHNRAHVKIRIKRDRELGHDMLAEVPGSIVKSYCAFYIKEFEGPLFCSHIPDFFKCKSFQKLEHLDVSVYDIATLKQVLACDKLSTMESATVKLYLETLDIDFASVSGLKIPKYMDLKLTIKYFLGIQDLIQQLECSHRLLSLSIHDLYVTGGFKLDLSAFKNLKTLYLICQPNHDDQAGDSEAMSIDDSVLEACPRSSWMLHIMMNIILPVKLERLMFRNMDFYNDSNNYLLLNILRKCNIERVMILDSQVTLRGVRKVLISLTSNFDTVEQLESMTKKMRMERENTLEAVTTFVKKPRLSRELRLTRQKDKPPGKELIITSNAGLCGTCKSFPCFCTGQEFEDRRETLEDLINIIEDIYYFEILSFTFVSNIFTVRKDLCGDLRVTCTLTELTDQSLNIIDPSSVLSILFYTLAVAQSVHFKLTKLTHEGIIVLVSHFKKARKSVSGGELEPFSMTVGSSHHYAGEKNMKPFLNFLVNEKCLASFNLWCTCEDKCYWIKKTYGGQIFYDNRQLNRNDLEEAQC